MSCITEILVGKKVGFFFLWCESEIWKLELESHIFLEITGSCCFGKMAIS